MKKHVIYSNYFSENNWKAAVENLKESGIESPSDDDIFEEMSEMYWISWEDARREIENFLSKRTFILFGTVERWNGISSGFDIVEDLDDIMARLKDCEEIEFCDTKEHFIIRGSHHDGDVSLELRELNERGMRYYENWCNNYNDKRSKTFIGNKLKTSKYSKLPCYCKIMWGIK